MPLLCQSALQSGHRHIGRPHISAYEKCSYRRTGCKALEDLKLDLNQVRVDIARVMPDGVLRAWRGPRVLDGEAKSQESKVQSVWFGGSRMRSARRSRYLLVVRGLQNCALS